MHLKINSKARINATKRSLETKRITFMRRLSVRSNNLPCMVMRVMETSMMTQLMSPRAFSATRRRQSQKHLSPHSAAYPTSAFKMPIRSRSPASKWYRKKVSDLSPSQRGCILMTHSWQTRGRLSRSRKNRNLSSHLIRSYSTITGKNTDKPK